MSACFFRRGRFKKLTLYMDVLIMWIGENGGGGGGGQGELFVDFMDDPISFRCRADSQDHY